MTKTYWRGHVIILKMNLCSLEKPIQLALKPQQSVCGRCEMNIPDPKPGSDEAVNKGCLCPIMDNGHGKGVGGNGEEYGWWVTSECPLHGTNPYRMEKEELINKLKEFQTFLANV
nr:MAG TPA: hypothetical protein [Caudoviricetes sp.]